MDGGCGAQRPLWRPFTVPGTAPGDGVRHGGHGCRPSGPPPPPRSDRSRPPPPASTATATTDRPPPSTRRGGGPQLAGHGGRAVAAAHGGPHCPPPPSRRPTVSMTPSTAPAGTRRPRPSHDARDRQSGAGRQGPAGGGLAVAAACRSPNRPAARGECALPTPRLPTSRRHARHYTQYSPAPHHTSPGTTRTPTTAPDTPPPPATPAAAPTARPPPHAPHARRAAPRFPPPLTAPVRPPLPTRCQPARARHGGLATAAARRATRHRRPTRKVPTPWHAPPDASFRKPARWRPTAGSPR